MVVTVRERLVWLDFLKGIAIIGVVVNHVFNLGVPICPSSLICELSFFNVSLFVVCGGVAASITLEKCTEVGSKRKKSVTRIMSLLGYYTLALALTEILKGRFNCQSFLLSWISFPAQFYFVLFFSELLFVAPIVYAIIKKCRGKYFRSGLCLIGIMVAALFCMYFTTIPKIYGGGGVCLGGSYLFLFSLGIFFALNISLSVKKTLLCIACQIILLTLVVVILKLSIGGAQGLVWALNPPGLLRMCYALFLFVGFYLLFKIRGLQSARAVRMFAWLGKHSLDIFLYHMLVQVILLKAFPFCSSWIWAVCCCLLICLGGVAIGKIVRQVITYCRQCY